MKKKILFVMNNLNCGGAEKALVSLLQVMDYSKYDVDVLLLKKEGLFLDKLPTEVNLLPSPKEMLYFDSPLKDALISSLLRFRWDIAFSRIALVYVFKTEKNRNVREQKMWKFLSLCLKKVDKKYDVAIGYLQKTPTYFCADKVQATKKFSYFLNDYDKLQMDVTIDAAYFKNFKNIVADSEECKNVLIKNFPQFEDKFTVQKNIVSPKMINKLANEKIDDFPEGFKLISVGRLSYQKGYDLAIHACKIIADKGLNFKWYILGNGEERDSLFSLINDLQLNDYFVFLGIRENHYPYVKQADVFVHTSRFEGFGIVIAEAKILNKPIVLTDFNVAKSHIKSEYNGLVCEMNPESIANSLERLILDKEMRDTFSLNLSKENFGTESEIEVFYKMIEN
jgi:glycosyltransferase involved in cell wall biosynthesis